MTFVIAASPVDDVVEAFEAVLVKMGTSDADEAVDEEVVQLGERFHHCGGWVGGKGDALGVS